MWRTTCGGGSLLNWTCLSRTSRSGPRPACSSWPSGWGWPHASTAARCLWRWPRCLCLSSGWTRVGRLPIGQESRAVQGMSIRWLGHAAAATSHSSLGPAAAVACQKDAPQLVKNTNCSRFMAPLVGPVSLLYHSLVQ